MSTAKQCPLFAPASGQWTSAKKSEFVCYAVSTVVIWGYYYSWTSMLSDEFLGTIIDFGGLPYWLLPPGKRYIYDTGLKPGWLPWTDRKIDLKDGQYRALRAGLPILCAVAVGFLLLRYSLHCAGRQLRWDNRTTTRWRIRLYVTCSCVFMVVLHGAFGAAHLAWILGINYLISGWCTQRGVVGSAAVTLSWLYACAVVWSADHYQGYRDVFSFASVPVLGPHLGPLLDGSNGMFRWEQSFRLMMLRMISFNMDRSWAGHAPVSSAARIPLADAKGQPGRSRGRDGHGHGPTMRTMAAESHCPVREYSIEWYLAYMLYVPLHIAGPIITFNSFAACVKGEGVPVALEDKCVYLARVVLAFLAVEIPLHYVYVSAMIDADGDGFLQHSVTSGTLKDPGTAFACALVALMGIYTKFVFIWRFFRAWALLDGVHPPENMQSCIAVTTTVSNFWKGWHVSYNKWLVRYMYVPLGGNLRTARGEAPTHPSLRAARKIFNVLVVFTFVAIWHDHSASLLAWGWIMAAMMIPEIVAGNIAAMPCMGWLRARPELYRHTKALLTLVPLYALLVGNMIGFSVGLSGSGSDGGAGGSNISHGNGDAAAGAVTDLDGGHGGVKWGRAAMSVVFFFSMAQIGYEHISRKASRANAHAVRKDT